MSNFQQGELVVDAVTIVNLEKESIDILASTSNITLYEAIDKPFLSGRITVVDGLELIKNYKLTGQESLTIKVRQREGTNDQMSNPSFSIDKVFRIYSITDVKETSTSTKTYVINFVDPKQFICQKTKINQTMRGSYSNMLLQVLQENAGFKTLPKIAYDKWDETEPGHHQMIVPNWPITKFIKFICENAELKSNKTWKHSMFFYQTINGEFRFDSFQSMVAREFPIGFDHYPRNSKVASSVTDLNEELTGLNTQILEYDVPKRFNTLKGTTHGAYASTLKTYDPIRKLEEENVYSISDVFKRGNAEGHVSAFPMIRTSDNEVTYKAEEIIIGTESPSFSEETVGLAPDIDYDAFVMHKVNMTNAFSDESKLIDATATKALTQQKGQEYRTSGPLERRALLSLLEQTLLRVVIPFRSDLSVGTIVRITLPSAEIKSSDGAVGDRMMDNRYLIGKMTMNITPLANTGTLTLHCVKDSYGVDIKKYKPLEGDAGPRKA